MDFILGLWSWLQGNGTQLALVLTSVVALGEAIVKLTPTTTDDGFVTRLGQIIDKILGFIPGIKK